MKVFSLFYRLVSLLLIFSFSGTISVISIEASQKDSLEEILKEVGIDDIAEKNNTSEDQDQVQKKENNITSTENNKDLQDLKTPTIEVFKKISTQEAQRNIALEKLQKRTQIERSTDENNPEISEISSQEIQRILDTVVTEEIAEKCSVPAEIPEQIQAEFDKAIENIPCHLLQNLRKVEIFEDPKHIFPRAMANGRILKIRSDAIEEPEFIKVLIHELGHVVDLGGLKSQKFSQASSYRDGKKIIYADDLSVLFYEISWINESENYPEISDEDFVGGYASYDMFEDYAESFLMYLEHGNEFRILAENNEVLQKKYLFFKTHVFAEKEFKTGQSQEKIREYMDQSERPWDITKL